MQSCQSSKLPKIWLMTDPRFGLRLYASIQKLPIGSGVILRHYDDLNRYTIYKNIAKICRRRGHMLVVAENSDKILNDNNKKYHVGQYYGRPPMSPINNHSIILIGVHNAQEINRAILSKPDLLLLSPLFRTNSHKGARPLGIARFRQLSHLCGIPILALGGANAIRARMIRYVHGYAAIDSLKI